MGIELPKDIQDMAIPLELDARGTGTSLSGSYDRAVDQTAYQEHQKEMFLHNNAQADGVGELKSSSVIDGTAGVRADLRIAEQEREKRDADNRDTQILLALQNRLDGLTAARDQAIEDLTDIRESKAALQKLQGMYKDGTLDPDNEDHQKIMSKAGISRDDLMTDPTGAFDRQAKFWDEREQNKIKEIEGIDRDIADTKKIIQAEPEERRELLRGANENIADAAIATNEIEQEIVTDTLIGRGFTQEETIYQANAAQNTLSVNGSFESNDTFASKKSFASTLDMGEPPAMLNLSADFDVAVNASAPSEPLPVLDLSSEFKFQ